MDVKGDKSSYYFQQKQVKKWDQSVSGDKILLLILAKFNKLEFSAPLSTFRTLVTLSCLSPYH